MCARPHIAKALLAMIGELLTIFTTLPTYTSLMMTYHTLFINTMFYRVIQSAAQCIQVRSSELLTTL